MELRAELVPNSMRAQSVLVLLLATLQRLSYAGDTCCDIIPEMTDCPTQIIIEACNSDCQNILPLNESLCIFRCEHNNNKCDITVAQCDKNMTNCTILIEQCSKCWSNTSQSCCLSPILSTTNKTDSTSTAPVTMTTKPTVPSMMVPIFSSPTNKTDSTSTAPVTMTTKPRVPSKTVLIFPSTTNNIESTSTAPVTMTTQRTVPSMTVPIVAIASSIVAVLIILAILIVAALIAGLVFKYKKIAIQTRHNNAPVEERYVMKEPTAAPLQERDTLYDTIDDTSMSVPNSNHMATKESHIPLSNGIGNNLYFEGDTSPQSNGTMLPYEEPINTLKAFHQNSNRPMPSLPNTLPSRKLEQSSSQDNHKYKTATTNLSDLAQVSTEYAILGPAEKDISRQTTNEETLVNKGYTGANADYAVLEENKGPIDADYAVLEENKGPIDLHADYAVLEENKGPIDQNADYAVLEENKGPIDQNADYAVLEENEKPIDVGADYAVLDRSSPTTHSV